MLDKISIGLYLDDVAKKNFWTNFPKKRAKELLITMPKTQPKIKEIL